MTDPVSPGKLPPASMSAVFIWRADSITLARIRPVLEQIVALADRSDDETGRALRQLLQPLRKDTA